MTRNDKRKRPCVYLVRDFLLAFDGATPQQKIILLTLSTFADPDGTRIFPSTRSLEILTGFRRGSKRKLSPLLDFWIDLKVLILVSEARPKHPTEFRIDLARIAKFVLVPPVVPSDDDDSVPPVVPSEKASWYQTGRDSVPNASDSVPNGRNSVPPVVPDGFESDVVVLDGVKQQQKQEALRAKVAAAAARINQVFELLHTYRTPYGSFEFQLEWLAAVETSHLHEGEGDLLEARRTNPDSFNLWLPDTIERCIQACRQKGITVPAPFFVDAKYARHFSARFNLK